MSFSNIPSALNPTYAPVASVMSAYSPASYNRNGLALDQFQRQQSQPRLHISSNEKIKLSLLHPRQLFRLKQIHTEKPLPDGLFETLHMTTAILGALTPTGQAAFQNLQRSGILFNTQADDKRSMLYHLYAMLTTPRSPGYNAKTLLRETVAILDRPYTITQKFAPLSEQASEKILLHRNYPSLGNSIPPPPTPLQRHQLQVESSATCVASSVMYYMADKEPSELARHLNELTSPQNAFFEKARFEAISPDNPSQALAVLQQNQIPYSISGPGEVTIKVQNPPAGVLRAIDSQRPTSSGHQARNAVQTAYQSALTFLATRSYDPATDMRDSDTLNEGSKGLTESEKTLMETIIKENGGVKSITYQNVASKANPSPDEESNSYLYGYNRSFEQTTQDILSALRMKEPVIVGTTDTDASGAIVTGHEITITGAFNDPKDNQLKFIVADSDDNVGSPVVKSARTLIPTIHHAGLPTQLSNRILQENQASANQYLIPDATDAVNFKLLSRQTGPMPIETEDSPTQYTFPTPAASTPQAIPPAMANLPLPGHFPTTATTTIPASWPASTYRPVAPAPVPQFTQPVTPIGWPASYPLNTSSSSINPLPRPVA